ncbi:hypothetical protein Tco_0633995 [Tanacetum coccineum]
MEDRRDKDKEANHAARDSDDALVCCVKNTVKDRIMDSGASFHATYCKEELKGSSYTPESCLKDVRYIPSLKRRLISVGQLDEEGYHKAVALHLLHQSEDPATMILLSKTAARVAFGVAERMSRTFRAESTEIRIEAPKMLWADSVITAYLIYRIPYVPIGLRIPEEEWRGKDTSLTHLKIKCDTTFGIRRVTRLSEAEISHLWTRFMEPKNDRIVAEHGLSSKITQSPGGSSNTSEGSENSESFEDSGRSDEEYSEDGASSKEGGYETP